MSPPAETASDRLDHQPGTDPTWQESAAIYWLDAAQGVGGGHRIGHEVTGGRANQWSGLFTPETRFRKVRNSLPLPGDGRAHDRMAAGTQAFAIVPGGIRIELHDDECDAVLEIEDFHPMAPWPQRDASVAETAADHLEASGRVTGEVRIGDRAWEVDGLAHHDHSWGPRRWDWVRSHRWVAGTIDADLSFSIFTLHDRANGYSCGGFVRRDGVALPVAAADVVVLLEADGLTHRGGTVEARLADGSTLVLDCTAVDGFVFGHREMTLVDAVCTVRAGDRTGFCCFEAYSNPREGSAELELALAASLADGLELRDAAP